tara:strand:- start:496 stop:741 length:246 start_codon:yes stop_codon:yes gene_type:complete
MSFDDNIDLAIELVYSCLRSTGTLEDIHADGRISQDEMKNIMEETITNLVMYLENPESLTVGGFWRAPPQWYEALERYNKR